jgi:hypothetical protein
LPSSERAHVRPSRLREYVKAGGGDVKRTLLIRFGGLVTMVGGLAATMLGLLYALESRGIGFDSTEKALRKGHYENPVATMLLVGVLVAIAALHLIQSEHYGRWGALTSVASFAGVAMVVVGGLSGELVPSFPQVAIMLLVGGVLAASVGIVGLGIATIIAGVLPRWCGATLLAGSPLGVGLLFMFSTLFVMARILPGEIGWALAGIPWMLEGYAIFRVGTRQPQQPSRVR